MIGCEVWRPPPKWPRLHRGGVLSGVHTAHDIVRHRSMSLCRPISSDVVRQGIQRCRTMSCAVRTPLYTLLQLRLCTRCSWCGVVWVVQPIVPVYIVRILEKQADFRTQEDLETIADLMEGLQSFRKYSRQMQLSMCRIVRYMKSVLTLWRPLLPYGYSYKARPG